jgi:hypothetical protein
MNKNTMSISTLLTMMVLWPSFLMAGLLEMFVFGLVDPMEMNFFGAAQDFSRTGIYTLGFFVFWAIVSCASGLTLLLAWPILKVRLGVSASNNQRESSSN